MIRIQLMSMEPPGGKTAVINGGYVHLRRSDWVRAPNNVISSKELLFKMQRRR